MLRWIAAPLAVLGFLALGFVLYGRLTFDRDAWLEDYAALKDHLGTAYANLDWMRERRGVDTPTVRGSLDRGGCHDVQTPFGIQRVRAFPQHRATELHAVRRRGAADGVGPRCARAGADPGGGMWTRDRAGGARTPARPGAAGRGRPGSRGPGGRRRPHGRLARPHRAVPGRCAGPTLPRRLLRRRHRLRHLLPCVAGGSGGIGDRPRPPTRGVVPDRDPHEPGPRPSDPDQRPRPAVERGPELVRTRTAVLWSSQRKVG
jgi:hypothetical protein